MRINIILVLIPLAFFKYFTEINIDIIHLMESINLRWPLPEMKYMLPIGISFYTFMAIGYTVDVYNKEIETEKNIGILALFFSFFPIILSGPIERAGNIVPQLKKLDNITFENLTKGAKLMMWGYFMKLGVADRLAVYVDIVYNNIHNHNGTTLAFASALYPFQVYADLGGYSLIAIGAAKCLGINVIPNFNRPFFASSMSEFWRRWHMSLIQWLTDYIFTPISFSLRKWKMWGIVSALMLTFIISGIWHGAALTFIIWGIIQGLYLSIEAITKKTRVSIENKFRLTKNRFYILISFLITFVMFAFSQIFGKSNNMDDATLVIGKIFSQHGALFIDENSLGYGAIFLFLLFLKDFSDEFFPSKFKLYENKNVVIRFVSYAITIIMIVSMGILDSGQFIYFQF